ncbi:MULTISPECIES: hypothetical protein [Bacillaceae]|uniref:Spore germination protein n=2 Tax=Bacillus infantis TaxID=324767 RepID=U5LAQ7_9BACI|nr:MULTISPECIES: hypothetical protein [Bacillus]OXT16344.1 hypothetical protein B9K06_15780 [Bacillus sp. OG2]AGX04934.1 hypothetical protein N288_15170 [Bacillus infantis NRRL B-14911]EAR67973.1 hypothetical protein B14911_24980 [Bacillus sp. NRRL B-14911]MCA1035334.1 hypothetical protein [Bacillus infantis]MCK6207444.1 hypothetical protein [Bacillus infantis]
MPAPAPFININICAIKINSFENASAVNIGQNLLAEWHNSDKKNQGYGQNFGDASGFIGTKGIVDDRDQLDSNSTFDSARIPNL